ncbi:MAG: PHP domain-containing protein, partial [Desulfamplus sp.]|nr:PHP domain-containing protein [Desulfamplus sp.]
MYADLHNHTTASDGDLSPEELILKMKTLGIQVAGVTDHDTDKGLERALAEGKKIGIQVIPGIEISVRFKEDFFTGTLHVLSYFRPELLSDSEFMQSLNTTLSKGRGDELVRSRVNEI